jgi:hypothetical protein
MLSQKQSLARVVISGSLTLGALVGFGLSNLERSKANREPIMISNPTEQPRTITLSQFAYGSNDSSFGYSLAVVWNDSTLNEYLDYNGDKKFNHADLGVAWRPPMDSDPIEFSPNISTADDFDNYLAMERVRRISRLYQKGAIEREVSLSDSLTLPFSTVK